MSGSAPRSLRSDLQRIGRRTGETARRVGQRSSETARDTGNLVRAVVAAEPYLAAAAALGVGFVAGGGLDRRTRAFLLGTGARALSAWLAQERAPRPEAGAEPDVD